MFKCVQSPELDITRCMSGVAKHDTNCTTVTRVLNYGSGYVLTFSKFARKWWFHNVNQHCLVFAESLNRIILIFLYLLQYSVYMRFRTA